MVCWFLPDKDMSDRNVYCDPFTSEVLPLDGDFEGNEVSEIFLCCFIRIELEQMGNSRFDSNFSLLC